MTVRCFHNGIVRTMNPLQPRAQALVVRDGWILFVGPDQEALRLAGPGAERIDLRGRLVLPGFIDNHVHFMVGGAHLDGLDLRPCRSGAEFRERTAAYVAQHRGQWVTGGDWSQETWPERELPCRSWLDPFSADTPVLLQRFDAHMAVANSLALERAGIGRGTPDPAGGRIDRDAAGEPTGILRDAAMHLVRARIPEPAEADLDRTAHRAAQAALALGITSVQDISEPAHVAAYRRLEQRGQLGCRIYARLPLERWEEVEPEPADPTARVRLGSMKAFADGSLGSATAWFFDPYLDQPGCGLAMEAMAEGHLRRWALAADRKGLQLSIHAIGDRANHAVLDIYEEIVRTNPPRDRRLRIEHAQHLRADDIPRMAGLGVIASAQPYHAVDDGCWAESRLGETRARATSYAFRSLLQAGVPLCFGSDWTVAPLDPLLGVHAAVTRATLDGKRPWGWMPEQRLTVEEAVRAYTVGGAYAAFEEQLKGSLAPGKLADLVVLEEDLFAIPAERIPEVRVAATVVGGETCYGS